MGTSCCMSVLVVRRPRQHLYRPLRPLPQDARRPPALDPTVMAIAGATVAGIVTRMGHAVATTRTLAGTDRSQRGGILQLVELPVSASRCCGSTLVRRGM